MPFWHFPGSAHGGLPEQSKTLFSPEAEVPAPEGGAMPKANQDNYQIQENTAMKFYKLNNTILIDTPQDGATELIPNTQDAAQEKHVPVIEQHGDHVTVKVGSVEHPMLEAHYIQWILLETATGYQKKDLTPNDKPEADFAVTEPVKAAYEYCNLHGLWKAEA